MFLYTEDGYESDVSVVETTDVGNVPTTTESSAATGIITESIPAEPQNRTGCRLDSLISRLEGHLQRMEETQEPLLLSTYFEITDYGMDAE